MEADQKSATNPLRPHSQTNQICLPLTVTTGSGLTGGDGGGHHFGSAGGVGTGGGGRAHNAPAHHASVAANHAKHALSYWKKLNSMFCAMRENPSAMEDSLHNFMLCLQQGPKEYREERMRLDD